ncbi:MAG: glycosyltransferase [Prevotellaceae bacterium]|jgi:glycosyltransferase involved in cell wall biosynthesis|nr:glycosyltransferase [Prevotellaceae bacterium]
MNKLTTIIAFLNEGAEIERTVASIRETAGDNVDILLINDGSHDGMDYETVARKYNARYHVNSIRLGAGPAKNLGTELCETPYFILFDGHMRFYHNDWWNETVNALENNDRAVYCLRCFPLDEQYQLMKKSSLGAYIQMFDTPEHKVLEPAWLYGDEKAGISSIQIPCVLGASYAASKRYWQYIAGYTGLRTCGCEEAYISLKTWLEGGTCILLKNLKVGHIFRKEFPYSISSIDFMYNKLMMAETLLPIKYKNIAFSDIHRSNPGEYEKAMSLLISDSKLITELKTYYKQIFTRDIDSFIEFNQSSILWGKKQV